MRDRRQSRALGPLGLLSRLVMALALVLFGAPTSQAERLAAPSGPLAESRIDQTLGVVTGQRPVLRAQLPGDDTPDAAGPGAAVQMPIAPADLRTDAAEPAQLRLAPIRILPPVRGPPAA